MFKCDKCGLCCKSIAGIEMYADLNRGDGICKYFNEKSNLCSIYDKRPLLCNVDKSYESFFYATMTRDEYEAMNYAACQQLKNQYKGKG